MQQTEQTIFKIIKSQKEFFESGATLSVSYRQRALQKLQDWIRNNTDLLLAALQEDLGKSRCEGFMTEISLVLSELKYLRRHTASFARPKRARISLAQFPGKSFTLAVPYGTALIMSPWNYPVQLTLCPLADCIAAGNCALVKPSAYAPATAKILEELITSLFPREYIAFVSGGRETNAAVLRQKYDIIFFTGGKTVGTLVAETAAKTLTPVVLELGGKSPCIVDSDADLRRAAKRIAFGKFLNAGQTCVAPDYVLISPQVKDKFLQALKEEIQALYGENPLQNDSYPHMINEKHFDRVTGLIDAEKVYFGGKSDRSLLKIQPTVLDGCTLSDGAMQEEIFGPVLPVLTFSSFEEAKQLIEKNANPLALYYFGKQNADRFLREISFGGGCINDTILHLASHHMGFGGVGESGMGAYHGKTGFLAFSHVKSIFVRKGGDLSLRYPPYSDKKLRSLRRLYR